MTLIHTQIVVDRAGYRGTIQVAVYELATVS
jgi:hypothetical protein